MFSGKSEELIRRMVRYQIGRIASQTFKPAIDDRYSKAQVVSHSALSVAAEPVADSAALLRAVQGRTEVVGIDEGQFFDMGLVEVVERLAAARKRVIVAGLDLDYLGRPFEPIPTLMTRAEYVTKTLAVCHRCGGAACEHSEPPSARHVLVDYAPTGTPRWEDFAQVCLEARHPEVDRLYEDPPAFVTLFDDAATLRSRLLGAFEAPGYELLGQVRAGFFPILAREGEGRGVLAVTFQAAGARGSAGRLRLGLNILGRLPGGGSLDLLWDRSRDVPWSRAVRWAQGALSVAGEAPSGRSGAPERREGLERRVEGILRGLARRLERDRRGRARRTSHAEERHRSGERPTRKALDDIRGARAEEILRDERNGTLVVPGDRGRIHFFTADGKLVSSVRYSRDAIERKRKLGLWRDASRSEAEAFLDRLRGTSSLGGPRDA